MLLPLAVHLAEHFCASLVVARFRVITFSRCKFFHATAGGGVGGVDAENVLVAGLRLIEFPEIVGPLCGVEEAAHGINILGVGCGESGIGADRIVKLCPHRKSTGVIWGDGLGEDLIHGGFGGSYVSFPREDAG